MMIRRHKYGARKTVIDGQTFDSQKEGARYLELKLLQSAGEIEKLQRGMRFEIIVEGQKICSYYPDFVYREKGEIVIEDAKGVQTPAFKLKWKLMQALFPDFVYRIT